MLNTLVGQKDDLNLPNDLLFLVILVSWVKSIKSIKSKENFMIYKLRTDNASKVIDAESMQEALEEAQEWLEEADNLESNHTQWYTCTVDGADGSHDVVQIQIDPDEPECTRTSHLWKRAWTWGHGSSIVTEEKCVHCGVTRITDTGATDALGQSGCTMVSYRQPGEEE